jgi:hypothetical protein
MNSVVDRVHRLRIVSALIEVSEAPVGSADAAGELECPFGVHTRQTAGSPRQRKLPSIDSPE